MSLTEALLRPHLSSPAKPLITHYDDATGARVELSVTTLVNWASKTANWLVEEPEIEPGDPVAVALPAHWQTAGVLLGAWWCGAHVVADAAGAKVAFTGPDTTSSEAELTAVVSLDPMGRGLSNAPGADAVDFLSDARTAGDTYSPLFPVEPGAPALLSSTVEEALAQARSYADKDGISAGDRVLSTVEWSLSDGVLRGLLAPLAAGASLVQVSNPDPAKLADRGSTERTTRELG
ncbi:TIGR03089 family protein [Amycolatopsis sp. 195334CR]|uniref:TIGR03089 family protein n=1 Tax=Amycolatopsis sp. 195334CR TaxID=2814588 RepID=UPI001A907D35|nr:TIGR03089 family protein [Amycolatopsis sp. 195334CR]MBN6036656.1 TIGR03089 family protein [Amycolatopsis sp. 195334CR]